MTDIGLPRDEDTERRRAALHLLLMASRYHPAGSWPALVSAALLLHVTNGGPHVSALVGGISRADLDALYSMRICDLFDTPPPGASVQARLHADARRFQADVQLLDDEAFVERALARLGIAAGPADDEWRQEREALAGEAGIANPEDLPDADLDDALTRAAEDLRDSLRESLRDETPGSTP